MRERDRHFTCIRSMHDDKILLSEHFESCTTMRQYTMTLLTPMPAPVWPTVTQPLSNRPPSGQMLFNQPLPSQPLSGQKLLDQPLISPRLPSLLPRAQPLAVQPSAVRPAVVQPPAAVPSSPSPTEHNTMGRPMRPRGLCRPVPGMGQPSLSARPPRRRRASSQRHQKHVVP